jgi:hypothetical protein
MLSSPRQELSLTAVENLFTLQILQPICVVGENLRDFKGADPEGVEFVVLSFIMSGCIPLKYQVPDLKLLFPDFSVESLFDLLLMTVSHIPHFLSDLLSFHYLMNPSDHMIWFSLVVLKELRHR